MIIREYTSPLWDITQLTDKQMGVLKALLRYLETSAGVGVELKDLQEEIQQMNLPEYKAQYPRDASFSYQSIIIE